MHLPVPSGHNWTRPSITTTLSQIGQFWGSNRFAERKTTKLSAHAPNSHEEVLKQVMIYMYAIPRALRQYRGITFNGKVVYADHEVANPASAVDDNFVGNLSKLILRLASTSPARRVPSRMECGFCNITSADCSDRAAGDILEEGATEDF